MAAERLSVDGRERLLGLLAAGDPEREVWFAWNAKEVVRQIYDHTDVELAAAWAARSENGRHRSLSGTSRTYRTAQPKRSTTWSNA